MSSPPGQTFTSATIAAVLEVKPGTLRQWVNRGHVRKLGRDQYDAETVIARWRAQAAP